MKAAKRDQLRSEVLSTLEIFKAAADSSALHLMLDRLIQSAPDEDLVALLQAAVMVLSDCGLEVLVDEAREQVIQTRVSLAEIELDRAKAAARAGAA